MATAFLRHWIYEYNNRDVRGQWQTILNELTDVTGDLFLWVGDAVRAVTTTSSIRSPEGLLPAPGLLCAVAATGPDGGVGGGGGVVSGTASRRGGMPRGFPLRELEQFEEPVRVRAEESALGKFPEDIQALMRKPESERTLLERQLAALAHRQVEYGGHVSPRI